MFELRSIAWMVLLLTPKRCKLVASPRRKACQPCHSQFFSEGKPDQRAAWAAGVEEFAQGCDHRYRGFRLTRLGFIDMAFPNRADHADLVAIVIFPQLASS